MADYKNHLFNLSTTLLKMGKKKEVFMISDLVNHISDPEHDKGKTPWVVDIEELSKENEKFRSTEWTGQFLQMTVMSLNPGEDIGLEVHRDVDQFIRIEDGTGRVEMGEDEDNLDQTWDVEDDFAIFIPAGTWHNVINTGDTELKLYSIYAEPEHPPGTIHETKEEAEQYELEHHAEDDKKTKKIDRSTFLYLEPEDDGKDFAQCQTCIMWTGPKSKTCAIMGSKHKVLAQDTCGFYISGKPSPNAAGHEKELVTPKEAGFERRKVRCENCLAFNAKDSTCLLFKTLNKEVKDFFDLEEKVHPKGCCNANSPKKE